MVFFYSSPMQVKYLTENNTYACGIAYGEGIIDAATGVVTNTSIIIERADDPDDAIIEWGDWVDLSPCF